MANKEAECLNIARISNPIPKRSVYSTEKKQECRKGSTGTTLCGCSVEKLIKLGLC